MSKRKIPLKLFLGNNTNALLVTISISVVLSFFSNLVLTRLLTPESFAIIGLVGSIFFILNLTSDAGFIPYIIRSKDGESTKVLDTVWSIRAIRGAVLATILTLVSKPVAVFIGSPDLFLVFTVCSVALLLDGLQSLSHATAERRNLVAKPLYIELGHLLFSKIVIISIAWLYHSYWAFVIGMLVDEFAKVITSYKLYNNSKRNFKIDRHLALDFWQYSKLIIPASILTVVLVQGDKIVISRILTLSEVGIYYLAFNLSRIGSQFVESYCTRIVFPYLSEVYINGTENFKLEIYKKKSTMLTLGAFGIGCLIGAAPFAIKLLYPEDYSKAGFYLSILLLGPVLRCITNPAEGVLFTIGQTKIGLQTNTLRIIWVVCMSAICFPIWGVVSFIILFSLQEILPCLFLVLKLSKEKLLNFGFEIRIIMLALLGALLSNVLTNLEGWVKVFL
jgi:O-antigen/teichoic acid export membrane protein